MSNVIFTFCSLVRNLILNSLWGGRVLIHELQIIITLPTQLLHSSQSLSFSKCSSWSPLFSAAKKSLIIAPVASKFCTSTNEQNVSLSGQTIGSLLQVQSVKQARSIVAVVKIVLRVIVIFFQMVATAINGDIASWDDNFSGIDVLCLILRPVSEWHRCKKTVLLCA